MSESSHARAERIWRASQAKIDDGSPDALRAAAARLEALAGDPGISDRARAHVLHQAGGALTRLLGMDDDAPARALECESGAAHIFKDLFIGGEGEVAGVWLEALSTLTQICARAADALGAEPLKSAWLEVDVARELFRGSSHWARIGVGYSNLGIGFLRIHTEQPEDKRDASTRDRALRAFEMALGMLEAGPAGEFEQELFVAKVNGCTCASLGVVDETELFGLTERCLKTYEWLVSVGRADQLVGSTGVPARCAVLFSMQRALVSFLDRGAGEHRLAVARSAASRLLLLAHPELWLPMPEKFTDPCRVAGELAPTEFLLGVEGSYLQAVLADADESTALAALSAIWPAPVPGAVFRALGRDEPWVRRLILLLVDRIERSRASEGSPAEQLAERFGKFLARWCMQPVAPIEELRSLREALMSDPESSHEERLRRVSLVVEAAADAARLWSQQEVEAILELTRAWSPPPGQGPTAVWSTSRIRLLGRLVGARADLLEELRDEAYAARTMLVSEGPPGSESLSLYKDAALAEAFALREIANRDGEARSLPAAELSIRLTTELERWGASLADAEWVVAAVGAEADFEQAPYEKLVREFRDAVAAGSPIDRPLARRLLALLAHRGDELEGEPLAAAREAVGLLLEEVRSGIAPPTTLSLFLALDRHPQLEISMEGVVLLAELGLRHAEERVLDDVAILLRFSLLAERYEASAEDRLVRVRVSERIARFVFASRQNLERIDPSLCSAFLAQQALGAEPARGATFVDRRGRIGVAVAALVAACAGGRAEAIAAGLWAVADLARLYDRETATALYTALEEHVVALPSSQLLDPMRRSIRADVAMFAGLQAEEEESNGEPVGPWDRQSDFIWRVSRFYAIHADSEFDDDELWRDVDLFVDDVEASGAADEDRASWILGAAQAASMSSRRGHIDERIARKLADVSLRVARSPHVPQTALGLPLFELSVLFAALIGEEELVRSALGSYRAAVNQRILMSPDFATAFDGVQSVGAIDRAATEALERKLGVGLEIVESGRAKLLTALAAGLLPGLGEAETDADPGAPIEGFGELVERLFDPSNTDPIGVVEKFLGEASWADVVARLVVPWKPVSHIQELDRLSVPGTDRVTEGLRRMALADPGPSDLRALASGRQVVAWALGDLDDPRVAMLVEDALLLGGSEEPPDFADVDAASRDELWGLLPPATRRAFNLRAANQDRLPAQARFVVIDCGVDPRVAVQVANGISLASKAVPDIPPIAPSVRLLRHERVDSGEAAVEATVFANPTGDLPGSLIEAAAWVARRDLEPRLMMQGEATVGAFLDALCESRLVVLSAHGDADPREGAALHLADGKVSIDHLLRLGEEIVAERVVLSCCWGGARSTWISQREALGVVNCLLALGVDEVVAPVESVLDLPTGIFGAGIARSYRQTSGVGTALLQARLDLAEMSPGWSADDMESWIRAGVSSGAVVAADQAQVEIAVEGLRQTTSLELMDAGQGFGLFGVRLSVPEADAGSPASSRRV